MKLRSASSYRGGKQDLPAERSIGTSDAMIRRMRFCPMVRDVEPPRDPDAAESGYVVEKALQPSCSGGMADQPHVQSDRHHFRMRAALLVQHVERVFVEREIVVRGGERSVRVFRIIVDQGIGNDEMWFARDNLPIWQLVVVGVRVIEEAALFG